MHKEAKGPPTYQVACLKSLCKRMCLLQVTEKNPKNCILQPRVHQAQDAEAVFRMRKQSIGGLECVMAKSQLALLACT